MVVLFVNDPQAVHFSYKRYLLNELRQALSLAHSPLVLTFRARTGSRGGKAQA
jgi:GTP-binding protein